MDGVCVGQGVMPTLVLHHCSLYITSMHLQQNGFSSLASSLLEDIPDLCLPNAAVTVWLFHLNSIHMIVREANAIPNAGIVNSLPTVPPSQD